MRAFSIWAAVSRTTACIQMASSGILFLLHHHGEQLLHPVVTAAEVQPAQQRFQRRGLLVLRTAGMGGNGVDVSVAAPAEHRLLLLCQQGQDALGQLRLLGGAHQRHRGPVQALTGGFAAGAEPCPHQHRILQLKELCKVDVVSQKESGLSVAGGKKAVTLAIIKQSDENMDEMKEKLKETTDYFASLYPDIEFSISRNQTELLDYTISNLQQNLSLGFLFIFIVAILFLGDIRSPLVIGISMVTSIVITFFFFYFCHVSLNVISLSGLILAVGMMIDSSIIVTENISQYRERGYSLKRSCAVGTTEMITPMLSSSLTTIAVFLPLIFMSGIAGAIFMDQAFSITVGLMISYVTGIMLLPVLYLLFYRLGIRSKSFLSKRFDNLLKNEWLEGFYDKGIDWVFSHKKISLLGTLATLPVCVFFFYFMEKERMPEIDQNELIMRIEWNENIHVDENNRRVDELMKLTDDKVV